MKRIAKHIEDETPILPHVIADSVIREAILALGGTDEVAKDAIGNVRKVADDFSDKADTLYNTNTKFRKRVRREGNEGRDFLYLTMRNWVGAFIYERNVALFKALPETFKVGLPLDKGGSGIQLAVSAGMMGDAQ